MRILYLADRLSLRGGADRHLLQVIGWAAERGHRVAVACGRREPNVALPSGVETVVVRGLASQTASQSRLSGLETLLDGAETVHVQNLMNPVALHVAVATGRTVVTVQDHRFFCPGMGKTLPDGKPCTVQPDPLACRECLPDGAYRERMLELTALRLQALRGARLVVLSRYMARELEAAGLPGARVIPPVVEVCREEPVPGEHVLLGGRLVRHKAPLEALRAWELAGRPLPLRVAGEGPLEEQLGGAVRLGWLDAASLRHELRTARALLFPSFWQEPFGILGIEALACGTPVIVAATGGTEDWPDAGCLRVPSGDVEAMAAAITRLARDPELAQGLGKAGRDAVRGKYGPSVIWPLLEGIYRE